jgi:hypothetical protein
MLNQQLAEVVQNPSSKKPKLSSLVVDLVEDNDDDKKIPAENNLDYMN